MKIDPPDIELGPDAALQRLGAERRFSILGPGRRPAAECRIATHK